MRRSSERIFHKTLTLRNRLVRRYSNVVIARMMTYQWGSSLVHWLKKKLTYKWVIRLFPHHTFYTSDEIVDYCQCKIHYKLHLENYNDWCVYYDIRPPWLRYVLTLIQPNWTILDVGANIGDYSMLFARQAIQGRVECFEPEQNNYRKLKTNIELNKFGNIRVHQLALGHEETMVAMETPDKKNSGTSRIKFDKIPDVKMSPLDQWIKIFPQQRLDLIKVDIEGGEYAFLMGAQKTILTFRPILIAEVNSSLLSNFQKRALDVLKLISEMNYKICDANNKSAITDFYEGMDLDTDIICYPN